MRNFIPFNNNVLFSVSCLILLLFSFSSPLRISLCPSGVINRFIVSDTRLCCVYLYIYYNCVFTRTWSVMCNLLERLFLYCRIAKFSSIVVTKTCFSLLIYIHTFYIPSIKIYLYYYCHRKVKTDHTLFNITKFNIKFKLLSPDHLLTTV